MKFTSYSDFDHVSKLLGQYYDQIERDFENIASSDILTKLNEQYKKPKQPQGLEEDEEEEEDDDLDNNGQVDDEDEVAADENEESESSEAANNYAESIDSTISAVLGQEDLSEPVAKRAKNLSKMTADDFEKSYQDVYSTQGNFVERIRHGVFNRHEKLKIPIMKDTTRNIFLKFTGFENDAPYKVSDTDSVFSINSAAMYERLCGNYFNSDQPSIAISGGIVVPNVNPVFSQIPATEEGQQPIDLLTGDFTSLYPTTCQYANICQTTAAYNPRYAIRIGSYLYDPFDKQCFNQIAAPLKINTCFTSVATFIIRPEIWNSSTSQLIGDVKRRRKETKNKMKKVEAELGCDASEYHILNFLQTAFKLLINTLYGIYLSPEYPSYRPYLGSLVTFYGRMALLRFFFSFHHALYTLNAPNKAVKGILGGDTDSLFLRCTRYEMEQTIAIFEGWPSNRGVYGVELEKQMWDGVFLGKKNYLMYGAGKFIIKGLFKRSYAPPCRTFLAEVLRILCERILRLSLHNNLSIIDAELDAAFEALDLAPESNFTKRQIMKKDVAAYTANTAVIKQLREIELRDPAKAFLKGSELFTSHYDFVFAPNNPNVSGPIRPENTEQARYIVKNPQCTMLVLDNFDWYKANYDGFAQHSNISRKLMLKSDLKTILIKIFKAFARSKINNADLFEKFFCAAYKRVCFFSHDVFFLFVYVYFYKKEIW